MEGTLYKRNKEAEKSAKKYSVIHWQTGIPKARGCYFVTTVEDSVCSASFDPDDSVDIEFFTYCIKTWCNVTDVKPYKE